MNIRKEVNQGADSGEAGQRQAEVAIERLETPSDPLESLGYWKSLEESSHKKLWETIQLIRENHPEIAWTQIGAAIGTSGEVARTRLNYNRKKYDL